MTRRVYDGCTLREALRAQPSFWVEDLRIIAPYPLTDIDPISNWNFNQHTCLDRNHVLICLRWNPFEWKLKRNIFILSGLRFWKSTKSQEMYKQVWGTYHPTDWSQNRFGSQCLPSNRIKVWKGNSTSEVLNIRLPPFLSFKLDQFSAEFVLHVLIFGQFIETFLQSERTLTGGSDQYTVPHLPQLH